jgi:hypothetical protein
MEQLEPKLEQALPPEQVQEQALPPELVLVLVPQLVQVQVVESVMVSVQLQLQVSVPVQLQGQVLAQNPHRPRLQSQYLPPPCHLLGHESLSTLLQ